MEIIYYQSQNVAGDFVNALCASFPQISVYTSVSAFCTRLRHAPTHGAIIVIVAADDKELPTYMSIRPLIEDAPIILIVPTGDAALLVKAHTFHPRFIGDLESGVQEVIAVIHKMLSREVDLKKAEVRSGAVTSH